MFGSFGVTELILILLIIVLLFGARKIPQIARGLGQGMRELRKAAREVQEDPGPDSKTNGKNDGPSSTNDATP